MLQFILLCAKSSAVSKTKDRIEAVKFAAKLKERRVSKGLKASWVAARMGVAASSLSRLEAGRQAWDEEKVEQFEKAIGEP